MKLYDNSAQQHFPLQHSHTFYTFTVEFAHTFTVEFA